MLILVIPIDLKYLLSEVGNGPMAGGQNTCWLNRKCSRHLKTLGGNVEGRVQRSLAKANQLLREINAYNVMSLTCSDMTSIPPQFWWIGAWENVADSCKIQFLLLFLNEVPPGTKHFSENNESTSSANKTSSKTYSVTQYGSICATP